jgi:hypothetical protein
MRRGHQWLCPLPDPGDLGSRGKERGEHVLGAYQDSDQQHEEDHHAEKTGQLTAKISAPAAPTIPIKERVKATGPVIEARNRVKADS